jgi:hypothetical protein
MKRVSSEISSASSYLKLAAGEGNLGGIGNPAEHCGLRRHGSLPQRYIPEKKPDDPIRPAYSQSKSYSMATLTANLSQTKSMRFR